MNLFTREEAAKLLRICSKTLDSYRMAGKLRFSKIGGKILIRQEDIDAALRPPWEK